MSAQPPQRQSSPYTIRHSAVPLKWEQLSFTQKEAAIQILGMLQAYFEEANNTGKDEEPIAGILENKASNIIFLDGSRGSGKTSLLISLIKATRDKKWSTAEFLPSLDSGNQGATDEENENDEQITRLVGKKALWTANIVWLNILNFELLPEPTNLLAAILVRLEEALKSVAISSEAEELNTVLFSTLHNDKSWSDFRELLSNVSLGWDSDLISRRTPDLDTYSNELLRMERARLNFWKFTKTLRGLAKYYKERKRAHEYPLFVIPVDDADLNPGRYLELFRLIRLIPSRHLVFLVSGKYNNLKTLFELSFLRDLNHLVGGMSHNPNGVYHHRIEEFAMQLGYTTRRKMIPSGNHLIRLSPFNRQKGSEFRPDNQLPQLKELLREIVLPKPLSQDKPGRYYKDYLYPAQNLWDLFCIGPRGEAQNNKPEKWSSISEILAAPPRSIYDLWQDLHMLNEKHFKNKRELEPQNVDETRQKTVSEPQNVDETRLEKVIEFIQQAYSNALEAEPALRQQNRTILEDCFKPTGKVFLTDQINRSIKVEPSALPRAQEYQPEQMADDKEVNSPGAYQFRRVSQFNLTLHASLESKPIILEDWRAAWGYLLHDISLLKPGNTIERINFSGVTQFWAQSHLSSKELETALEWPSPTWLCFSSYERFRIYWNDCLEAAVSLESVTNEKEKHEKILEYLAFCWCRGITNLILKGDRNNTFLAIPDTGQTEPISNAKIDWPRLGDDLCYCYLKATNKTLKTKTDNEPDKKSAKADNSPWSDMRSSFAIDWINKFCLLISPESALPIDVFKKFQRSAQNKLKKVWLETKESRDSIIEARASRILKIRDHTKPADLEDGFNTRSEATKFEMESGKRNLLMAKNNIDELERVITRTKNHSFEEMPDLRLEPVLKKAREMIS